MDERGEEGISEPHCRVAAAESPHRRYNFVGLGPKKETLTKLNQPPHKVSGDADADSIGVLHALAESLGSRVTKTNVMLMGNTTLTRQLRALDRGHKIELLANDSLILADVEANYGRFELLKINPRSARTPYGRPAGTINTAGVEHVIFTIDGSLSRAQAELYESGVLERLLNVIDPHDGEEINVSQRLFRVYLRGPSVDRVMAIIHGVIDLMPHDTAAELDTFPDALRPLVPLMTKWAIEDDEERSRKLRRCTQSARQRLVDAVVPLLPAIDQFLDNFGANPPEEACALGTLAQAALEARSLISGVPDIGKPNRPR